jgi:hypothetical protein
MPETLPTEPDSPAIEPETAPEPDPSLPKIEPDLKPFDPPWPEGRPEPQPKARLSIGKFGLQSGIRRSGRPFL